MLMLAPAHAVEKPNVLLIAVDDLNDWSDLSEAARKLTLSNAKIPIHDWMLKKNRWQEAVHAYLACVRWTDEQVGRVLDALEAGPHAGDTIVVLFSDHGYHLGEKQRWSKFSLWERTTRVPLVVSVPGGLTGSSDEPVELLSIYPALIDLCGLPLKWSRKTEPEGLLWCGRVWGRHSQPTNREEKEKNPQRRIQGTSRPGGIEGHQDDQPDRSR